MFVGERKLEIKTRGLVCGPTLIAPPMSSSVTPVKDRRGSGWHLSDPRELERLDRPVIVSWKVVVASRETREELWVRPFASHAEAKLCYLQLTGLEPRYHDRTFSLPSVWHDGEFSYYIATVTTYNATTNNSGLDWAGGGTACPAGVTAVDWLLIGGAASGGARYGGGGGGAGGYQDGTALAVTPTTNYPVTIGAGGASRNTAGLGNDGNDSTWNSNTALKGGGGGYNASGNGTGGSGTYGCGGGAAYDGVASRTGGAGTAGQGFAGGNCPNVNGTGGGGGSSAAGTAGITNKAGDGGAGTSSSISGSALFYAGGGGGGGIATTLGAGGSSVGGAGTNGGTAGSGTANRGAGGGGAGGTGTSGAGSDGILILSYTASTTTIYPSNLPMLGM